MNLKKVKKLKISFYIPYVTLILTLIAKIFLQISKKPLQLIISSNNYSNSLKVAEFIQNYHIYTQTMGLVISHKVMQEWGLFLEAFIASIQKFNYIILKSKKILISLKFKLIQLENTNLQKLKDSFLDPNSIYQF